MKIFLNDYLKPILFILPLVLIIPIITGAVLKLTYSGYTIGDENAWVAFYGSYVGGVTGGVVAYLVAKMQINQLREEAKLNHARFYAAIERDMHLLKDQLPSLKHHLEYGSHAYYEIRNKINKEYTRNKQINDLQWNLDLLNSIHSTLIGSMKLLRSFNLSDIPPKIAIEYQSLLRAGDVFDNQISQFIRNEREILNFWKKENDFEKIEKSQKMKIAIADNKRISEDIQTHIKNYEEKVKGIDDFFKSKEKK